MFSNNKIISGNQNIEIHTYKLAKGVYVLQVIGKGNVEYRRIVVE